MRLGYLDSLRGLAVIAMVIFHTSYDLKMLRLVGWDFSSGFWYAFPRLIAFTFLFCVGTSLHLSHSPKINWNHLKKRSLKLAFASGLISLATLIIFPKQWIFFGTLHCILAGSILGALLVNRRKLCLALFLVILFLQYVLNFDIKWVASIIQRPSMDFIPIYPWFWVILLGILLGPYLSKNRHLANLRPYPFLTFLSNHSLLVYLIHQPIIFGMLQITTLILSKLV